MRYVPAIALMAALAVTASSAVAASKKHPRYLRPRAPAVVTPAPSWNYDPGYIRPRAYVPPNTCIQDEGYGRWTYCGQGRS